jgi:hypothetical protein
MQTVFGEVVVGEHLPMTIPLSFFSVIEEVDRDITSPTMNYPFSCILGQRFGHSKREFYLGVEVSREIKKKDDRRGIEAAKEEFEKDFRSGILRSKVVTGGYLGKNASTGSRYSRKFP